MKKSKRIIMVFICFGAGKKRKAWNGIAAVFAVGLSGLLWDFPGKSHTLYVFVCQPVIVDLWDFRDFFDKKIELSGYPTPIPLRATHSLLPENDNVKEPVFLLQCIY